MCKITDFRHFERGTYSGEGAKNAKLIYIPYIIPTSHSYIEGNGLFYFLHFGTNPLDIPFSIRLFGYVINIMSDNLFDDVLIDTGFLCHCNELNTAIMRTVPGIELQIIAHPIELADITIIDIIGIPGACFCFRCAEKIFTMDFFCLMIPGDNHIVDSWMNRNSTITTGACL